MRRAERLVLVGPSGQGKSTLLKIISGLIPPSQGEVLIHGQNVYKSSRLIRKTLMDKIGMLFQKNALFDSLTVGENLAFPLREVYKNLSEADIIKRVEKFLTAVDLENTSQLFTDEISGGMQKRVGIARALVLTPEIILYDDPTAGLDPITSRIIVDLILKLQKEFFSTIVIITNDMQRAYQIADRIAVLIDGKLIITGSVEETKKFPNERIQDFITGRFSDVN